MIIQSLTMENFRQYYGFQTIEFAHSRDEQVVTVILGENGRGKTGIYRAMMLALFGDVKLEQDASEADIYLANMKALEESSLQGDSVTCSVSLKFCHDGEQYTITRSYVSIQDGRGKPKERLVQAILENHSTGRVLSNEKEIQPFINRIIHEKVKHYFFFDGERIERLTRVSAQQKEEVTSGIKNLLKIDQVLKTKEIFSRLVTKVKKELAEHSTGEYKKALKEQSNLEVALSQSEQEMAAIEKEKKGIDIRLMEIDEELDSYESMKQAIAERFQLEGQMDALDKQLIDKKNQLKEFNTYLPHMLADNLLYQQLEYISCQLSDINHIGIQADYIDSLLANLKCICGQTFSKESSQYDQLQSLKESIQHFEKKQDLFLLKQDIQKTLAYLEGREVPLQRMIDEVKQMLAQKENIHWKLEELNKGLTDSGETHIKLLNQEREQLTAAHIQLNVKQAKQEQELSERKEQLDKLNLYVANLQKKSGIHKQLLKKHDVLVQSLDTLKRIITQFETEIIKELESVASQNLYYLLDQSGQAMIKEVQINKDYSLEVMNAFGQPFLANISQGQRQVLSLSFITALAQVAGGHRSLEMPLFMDTPFGRLSAQHQENLIEYLPQICSQWVLLVTDKEFGPQEKEQFLVAGTIGKMYELKSEEAGVTKIIEVDYHNAIMG